ncbi:hypothetical protein JCM10207_001272 [Rhodosporidiobolus poonsookiae]
MAAPSQDLQSLDVDDVSIGGLSCTGFPPWVWERLPELHLYLDDAIWETLDRQTTDALPFRNVSVRLSPAERSLDDELLEEQLRNFAAGILTDRLKRLAAPYKVLKHFAPSPSVKHLELDFADKSLATKDALFFLTALLETSFPSLVSLEVHHVHFEHVSTITTILVDDDDVESDNPPNSLKYKLHHLALLPFLDYLRSSTVLVFKWNRGVLSDRWVRRTREEDFQVDRYRPF